MDRGTQGVFWRFHSIKQRNVAHMVAARDALCPMCNRRPCCRPCAVRLGEAHHAAGQPSEHLSKANWRSDRVQSPRSSQPSAGGGVCGGRDRSRFPAFLTARCTPYVLVPVAGTMQALARATKEVVRAAGARGFASGVPDRKVAVLGAAGGIGQPLSLLMKVGVDDKV